VRPRELTGNHCFDCTAGAGFQAAAARSCSNGALAPWSHAQNASTERGGYSGCGL